MSRPTSFNLPWLKIALSVIFGFSLYLRFWHLGQFNVLVFDEVYYAVFANNYLTNTNFFNAHPPLCQYLIAIGIWLGSHFPWGQDQVNGLSGSLLSTLSYRWLNAVTGAFIPVIIGAIAFELTNLRSYGVIAAWLAAMDGLFLVESRYALSNIYLVIFGLLGQLWLLFALGDDSSKRWLKLALAGVFFGASVAVKWNGLGFLLGIYLLWCLMRLRYLFVNSSLTEESPTVITTTLLQLKNLNLLHLGGYLGIIPALTYSLLWIPHLIMNPQYNFWEIHQQIWGYHQQVGGSEIHPYCSSWYHWLWMWRPIAYFYHRAIDTREVVPNYPPLPDGVGQIIYDVHALGNPILWWLSTGAILVLSLLLILAVFYRRNYLHAVSTHTWASLFIVVNYGANFLPWVKVTRCTFLYHYMSASVFATLALAWILDRTLRSHRLVYRWSGIVAIAAIVAAFCFWLPIYLGIPLSIEGYRWRMVLFNWV